LANGIARDYSIASPAANAWNFKTRLERFRQLLGIEPPGTPAVRRRQTRLQQQNPLLSIDSCAPSATILVTARAAALLSAQRGAAQPGYGLELRSDSVRLSFEYFTFLQAILHAATWFAKSESSRDRRRVAPPIRPLIHQSCGPGCDAAYLNL
jgi:hypothetical protein